MDRVTEPMGEHRVSMLGLSLRRNGDPATSRDPRVQAVVRALKDADYAPAPRSEFRDELRAQLVAVAPRVVAEGDPVSAASASNAASTGPARHRQGREARFPRPLAVAASVIALLALVLGGATWLSQKALPGDALYGLKRASENVRFDLTSGDTSRGVILLKRHTTRIEEAQDLLGRTSALGSGVVADGISPHTRSLVSSNLTSASDDLTEGVELLNKHRSSATNNIVRQWAVTEWGIVDTLAHSLSGSPKVQEQALDSRMAVADTLVQFGGTPPSATPSTSTRSPAAQTKSPRRGGSTSSVSPKSKSRTTSGGGNGQPTSTPTPGGSHTPNAGPSAGPSGGSNTSPSAPVTHILPKPPNILTSPPVSVGSCGVQVSLGSISAGVSTCPTG